MRERAVRVNHTDANERENKIYTHYRGREAEEDSAVKERLVSVDDEPDSKSEADGEEPDGVNEPALGVIVVVSSLVVVTH